MFKKGSKYTRKEVGWIVLPETGRPKGGSWDTGYVRIGDVLLVFMNIGVPGRTNHDFDNEYDEDTGTITWFGKPKSHSKQPIFCGLLDGSLTPHFFARWDNTDPKFTYLGVGKVVNYADGAITKSGINAIKLQLRVNDIDLILPTKNEGMRSRSAFMFERHLEDFLITNWVNTHFADRYVIYEKDGKQIGKQYPTDTGPLDILAISKDENEFLVIELKRDRASDQVVGQILRYMGWIKKNLCSDNQRVKGCIVALEGDQKLENALFASENISFIRYEVDFRLIHGFS